MNMSELQVFFDLFPDPCLLLGPTGVILRANAAMAAMIGRSPEMGRCAGELLEPGHEAALHAALERLTEGAEEVTFTARLLGVAGEVHWRMRRCGTVVQVFLAPQVSGPRDDLLSALAAQSEADRLRLQATLDALPDMLFEFDRDRRFVNYHCPPGMAMAQPPHSFLGRRIDEVLPPDVAEIGLRAMDEVDAKGHSAGLRYSLPDAESRKPRWYEIAGSARQDARAGYVLLVRDVTERVEGELRLEYHAQSQRAFFELSPVGIVLADMSTLLVVDVNDAFSAMTGFDRAELVGIPGSALLSDVVMDERQEVGQQLRRSGRFGPVELNYRSKDGAGVTARVSGVRVAAPDGGPGLVWALVEDVTEERAQAERLRQAEAFAVTARQQLLAAVESLADGFVLYDAEDRLVMANQSYRDIYTDEEAISTPGQSFADIVRRCIARGDYLDAAGREEEFFEERMALHRSASTSVEHRLSEGRVVRIEERCLPDGGRVGLHVLVTDLHRAREAAEGASRAKSAFLAHMGHEIRTPLAGILGMTELLLERLDNPEQVFLARAVHQSGETLLTILNDLLDMSKIEAGKLDLEEATIDPSDLVRSVAALYELRTEGKGLSFTLDIDPQAVGPRLGDGHRIAQILHNLLSNALKFTATGGLTLSLRQGAEGGVIFSVRDTGIGMTPEQAERMLKPFEQAEAQTTRRYGGTGLGMAIVARLVEMMGGRLEVQTRFGAGTEISVHLPLRPAMAETAPSEGEGRAIAPASVAALHGLRVLAADDNEINRHMLKAHLDRLGVVCTMVEDGQQALDRWEAGAFDILCLDISMPVLDGIAALNLIHAKARAQGAEVPPAIAITSNAMTHQISSYLAAGFSAHLGKPFRKADLIVTLGRFAPQSRLDVPAE